MKNRANTQFGEMVWGENFWHVHEFSQLFKNNFERFICIVQMKDFGQKERLKSWFFSA